MAPKPHLYVYATALLLLSTGQPATGQLLSEAGFGLGASIYQGALSPRWIGSYNRPGVSFQLTVQKNLTSFLSFRTVYAYASLAENEGDYTGSVHQLRNFSFKTVVNEFAAQILLNPFFNNGRKETGQFRPYIFAGAGLGFLRVERDWSRFDYSYPHWQSWVLEGLVEDSLITIPSSLYTFPVGAGLRYQIGENVSLYVEGAKRLVSTGYLDGFSKSVAGTADDSYGSIMFGFNLRLFNARGDRGRIGCPKDVW